MTFLSGGKPKKSQVTQDDVTATGEFRDVLGGQIETKTAERGSWVFKAQVCEISEKALMCDF